MCNIFLSIVPIGDSPPTCNGTVHWNHNFVAFPILRVSSILVNAQKQIGHLFSNVCVCVRVCVCDKVVLCGFQQFSKRNVQFNIFISEVSDFYISNIFLNEMWNIFLSIVPIRDSPPTCKIISMIVHWLSVNVALHVHYGRDTRALHVR